jgi:pimeloyl-ACP methyl ester carboxylesterase
MKTKIEYIERNHKNTLVLIPGWAMDCSIFNNLDLPFNYILINNFNPSSFAIDLNNYLKRKNISKISLLGFSLGGFLALDYAKEYSATCNTLYLFGIRKAYPNTNIKLITKFLLKNKNAYLFSFYKKCFHTNSELTSFRPLLSKYLSLFSTEYLIETLNHFKVFQIESFPSIANINIFHGIHDQIAPIKEIEELTKLFPNIKLHYLETGHCPFYAKDAIFLIDKEVLNVS